MAGLKLKCDPKSGVIRSVGDAPNGILGMSVNDEGAHWVIDPFFDPVKAKANAPQGGPQVHFTDEAKDEREKLTPEQVVEACEGNDELGVVWLMVEETTTAAIGLHTRKGWFDFIRAHVDQLEATCDAIAARIQQEGTTL